MQASRLATSTQSNPSTQVCCIASSASILTKRGAGNSAFTWDPRLDGAQLPNEGGGLWVGIDPLPWL